MKDKVYIFFDEFGNTHLDLTKEGTFSHYVYTAILIKESNIDQARQIRNGISKKHFQNRDIKSSSIKNNEKGFQKRLNVLDAIKKLNFVVYSFVINKAELKGDGLKYKQVFIKYFQKLFVQKFANMYSSFEIFADEVGHPEFKRSLAEFVNKNAVQRDLWNPDRNYQLSDDVTGEKLIQIADFLSGCLGKIYCTSHMHPQAHLLFERLKERLFVEFFPYQKSYFQLNLSTINSDLDSKVSSIAFELAENYLSNNKKNTSNYDIDILNHLLLTFRTTPNRLVDTKELVNLISSVNSKYNEHNVRQAIAHLRDRGVLIVSIQGKYGYKIPNCLQDISGFYNRYMNSIIPMLKRIKKSNDILKLNSVNEINMLEIDESFETLTKLIGVYELESTLH